MRAVRSVILGHLAVKDFALIEDVEVELQPGLNIITGETGAGKSLFVDAVEISLGRRGSSEFIRTGAPESVLQALFFIPDPDFRGGLLERLGIQDEGGQVLVERLLRRDGNNRARINGRLASVTTIRNLASAIVDLHGQGEQHGLLSSAEQLEMLDSLAGERVPELRERVAELHRELNQTRRKILENLGDEKERARQLDLLQYQLREIDEARLQPEEEEELQQRRRILGNLDLLRTGAAEFSGLVMEGAPGRRPLVDQMGELEGSLRHLADIDEDLGEPLERLRAARFEIEEVARTLRHYREALDFDPRELHRVEERLDLIGALKRKYGSSVREVLEYRDGVAREMEDIENSRERVEALRQREVVLVEELGAVAADLSDLRKAAASQVEVRVEEELADLSMENTEFDISFSCVPD
ncbi:MAG: AAA family ATPase, partial [Bacillota bacterium]